MVDFSLSLGSRQFCLLLFLLTMSIENKETEEKKEQSAETAVEEVTEGTVEATPKLNLI